MAAAPGFLEFFILEASDYIERLDALLLGGKPAGPDGDAMQRAARALRGTATMAKLPAFAELAAGVERVGRAIHDGSLNWEPALSGAMIAAIDDLKTLLHAARSWSGADDKRARDRASELARFAPMRAAATPASTGPVSSGTASAFLATEAANIAAGLELLTARSGDPETAANVLRRVRALRGVAGVKEVAPLADALEATEDAARGLETTRDAINPETRRLLEASAGFLRSLSSILRSGGDVRAPSAARDEFDAARSAVEARGAERERIIPIAKLFYDDGGAGVVEASPHPPTTASERFRLELVSLGEHLRQVVNAARDAGESAAATRAQRDVKRALQALEAAAESFGEHDIADLIRSYGPTNPGVDSLSQSALDDLAGVLTTPGAQGERLRERLRELAGVKDLDAAIGAGFGRSTPPAPAPAPSRARVAEMSATELLDTSISALEAFVAAPMAPPSRLPEEEGEVVPIESLLYRGRAALDRAVELRDAMKRAGVPSDPDGLEELFDLLELARAD